MDNMVKNIIIALVIAGALFLGYRWWKSREEVSSSTVKTATTTTEKVAEATVPVAAEPMPATEPATTAAAEQVAPATEQQA